MKGAFSGSLWNIRMMLNTEVSWNKALTDNNIKGLIGCLRGLYTEGEGDVSERVAGFNCWLERSAELAKKELLMFCFGRCIGLWMCLDENSVALVHKLLLKLKNLLTLVHLIQKHSNRLHSKHGSRASYIWGCLTQDHHAIWQHILLGRLVQWWSITGLLPKHPEAHEMKRISQMWCEMDQKHRKTCLELSGYAEDKCRWSSLIQVMVAHMDKQHGPVWVSEDCAYQTYPPPSLEALLKLVLLPNIDILSVQAIIMYFVLDVSNFLHCKDDLLQSFCHVFSIPSAFSQQICGFWLLDHGLVTDSMDVLLSPRACPPTLPWHHCAVLRTLLKTGENRAALKYLYSITPVMESIQDIKLCVDVLIHNKCISEAWTMIRGLQTKDVHLFRHFIHVCENHGICSNMLTSLCEGLAHLQLIENQNMQPNEAQIRKQETVGQPPVRTEAGQTPRPLSSWLYRMNDPLAPGDFVKILRQSISEICPLPKKRRVVLLLPKYLENSVNSAQLSSQALGHVAANSTLVDIHCKFKQRAAEEECEEDLPLQPEEDMNDSPVFSSPFTSPDSMESVGFFKSSCSSPPAFCSEAPSAQGPILLKQNSSAEPEEEESHIPDEDKTLADMMPGCPDLTLTLDGATEALSINSLSRESVVIEKIFPGVETGVISHSAEGDAVGHAERRFLSTLNLHPNCYSNEDNQSVCSIPEIPAESHNFLSPNHEKFTYNKTVDDAVSIKPKNLTETEEWIISPSEPKTEFVRLQDSKASRTCSLLELKPLRRALSPSRVEECQEDFCRDPEDAVDQPEILTSCALTDTMHNLLAHLQHADLLADDGEPYQACSLSALKSSIVDMDLSLIHLSQQSRQLQNHVGSQSSPVYTQRLSVSQQSRHRSSSESRITSTKEAVCFRTTSDRVGHCKLGSWWKQALETRRASTGLLPALEQVSPVTREKRTSPIPRGPQPHGLGSFLDPPSNPRVEKREVKQAVKDEVTGRRGSLKVAIHQIDHGPTSHQGRRGKMRKQIKRA